MEMVVKGYTSVLRIGGGLRTGNSYRFGFGQAKSH
jgi:hypothetical protein